jgi:hypothetical protein
LAEPIAIPLRVRLGRLPGSRGRARRRFVRGRGIDLGAINLPERYARTLGPPMAIVGKQRLGPR